ncbi:MAG TPA: hypothetical protein VNM68_14395 [Candidatus Polarisedimenticolia bacterium]|nr:hypothetical protein [Candidatus Polarisedimenticolia bacterium]
MKKAIGMVGMVAFLLATISIATLAAAETTTWTGWISDSHCGAKGMSATHKACAIKCVTQKGASWVFVDGKTKKVVAITNQDAVKPDADLGHEVTVTGRLESNGSLQVDKIEAAKM